MKKTDLSIFKAYLIPILVLVIVVLIVPFVLMPQLRSIRDKNVEVQKGRERLELLNQKISDLTLVNENEESIKLLEVEKVIPSDKKLAALIIGVKNLALESALSNIRMTFNPGQVASQSATQSALSKSTKSKLNQETEEVEGQLIFDLEMDGKLTNLAKFLSKIEFAKRLLGINSVDSTFDSEISAQNFVLKINAPFKILKSSGDVIGQPLPELTQSHESTFEFIINRLKDYTSKRVPTVPIGVKNPFKD